MSTEQQLDHTALPRRAMLRAAAPLTLIGAGVAIATTLSANGEYSEAVVVASAALLAGLVISIPISVEAMLITWFAATPLVSFYLRFPTDRSIVTFSRVVFVSVIAMLLLRSRARRNRVAGKPDSQFTSPVPAESDVKTQTRVSVSGFEAAWALLSILALISALSQSNNAASGIRSAVDTFWLPLLAFHIARNHFDVRGRGSFLLMSGIGLALFLFLTGAFEFLTGNDVLQYKGSELVREGERRVNGPFAADSSYAIVCLMLFLFLLVAPRLFRVKLDRAAKLAYAVALAAVALGALLPMFRAVALALVPCWIVLRWFSRERPATRAERSSILRARAPLSPLAIVVLMAIVAAAATLLPSLRGSRLADPRTAFGRLATWQAAAQITFENAAFGVGLGNYSEYFDATHYYADEPVEEVLETRAADSPHSNVLWIAAELGLLAVVLYIAANVYIFMIAWRALKNSRSAQQRVASSCLLALVVAYWIPGFTLASGYYADLNLYFFFFAGLLSNSFFGSQRDASRSVDFAD